MTDTHPPHRHRPHRRRPRDDDGEGRAPAAALSWTDALAGLLRWLFFAAILLAALPLGANRPWAWSPIVVFLAALAVLHAIAPGAGEAWRTRAAERPLLWFLLLCGAVVLGLGILQLLPAAPRAWHADLYARAGSALGRELVSLPSVGADATRAALMRIAACALVFLMARALLRDRRHARLFLLLFVASAVLVTIYGLVMQATNGSCYVFAYSKRPDYAPPGRVYLCALSGTFVSSNNYAAYAGMAMVADAAEAERNKVSPWRGFWSVTLGGAEALYIDDLVGNFAPGKEADFVALDWNAGPRALAWHQSLTAAGKAPRTIEQAANLLFGIMMVGDDRAVAETWVMGKRLYKKKR